jgi:hypothetical protein
MIGVAAGGGGGVVAHAKAGDSTPEARASSAQSLEDLDELISTAML